MSERKKHYLHRQLVVSTFWVALLFAGVISAVSFFAEYRRASEKNQIMLTQLLDTMESTAAVAAYSGNRAIAEDVLKGLLRNDIVHEARLHVGERMDLRQTRNGAAPAPDTQPAVARALHSPFGEGETIGTLSVIPEARLSLQEARYSALLGALNSAGVIGLTALILLVMIRSSLSRPLLTVSSTLHAIKVGEAERITPLARHKDDELGQLVRDINALLDSAQEKFEEERRLLQQIQAVERQLRGIFENTSAGIFLLDEGGRLLTANPTLARVVGLPDEDGASLAGCEFASLAFAEPDRFHDLLHLADEQNRAVAADLQLHSRDGMSGNWVHCLLSRHRNSDGALCFEGVAYDINERRALEMRVRHEADHDPLTGLRRRQAFERDLIKLLETAVDSDNPHAMLLLDLDNFKDINDSYGHAAGDMVLIEVARRLKGCVRSNDIVARLGGDEFVIMLANCVPMERAYDIARNLIASVIQPITIGRQITGKVGVSIGIAVHDERNPTMAELFEMADFAMYEVKRQGKNGFGIAGDDGIITVEKISVG
ncbi:MAG: diguanylate cyclase domain-containing protein [Candidatus Methylumidiphilus sp.]